MSYTDSVNPDLQARVSDRLKKRCKSGELATDKDILQWNILFFDMDGVRVAGISETAKEKKQAEMVSQALNQELTSRGWPPPAIVDSGNGYYLIYRVELSRDDDDLIANAIKGAAGLNW